MWKLQNPLEPAISRSLSATFSKLYGTDHCAGHHEYRNRNSFGSIFKLYRAWNRAAIPEWGSMLSAGRAYIRDYWFVVTFPGLAIMLTVFAFNLFGDGLRDALDPRLKR